MRSFSRHLGATVSAMVDGQLPADELDRAWRHVLDCTSCRDEVEREMWLKQRLSSLGAPCPTDELSESLAGWPRAGHGDGVVAGWSRVVTEDRLHRRRTGVAVGAASVVALMGWGLTTLVDQNGSAPAGANVGSTPTARPTPVSDPGASRGSEGLSAPTR
jgi:hypothetical protein